MAWKVSMEFGDLRGGIWWCIWYTDMVVYMVYSGMVYILIHNQKATYLQPVPGSVRRIREHIAGIAQSVEGGETLHLEVSAGGYHPGRCTIHSGS